MSDQMANSESAEGLSGEEFSAEIPVEPVPESGVEQAADSGEPSPEQQPEPARNASFEEFGEEPGAHHPEPNLDVILNIKRGSVVKFNRLAGEPMDVLVNGTLIAHGEVVVINDKFGIRLIDVISPAERVRKLR